MRNRLRPLRLRRRATTDQDALLDGITVDADEEEPEAGPLRRCVVTRERLPKERMFRFVVSPDRLLIPDLAGKLPGRGIWLSASRDVIEGADNERPMGVPPKGTFSQGLSPGAKGRELVRAIARAARGPVRLPPDLPGVLETALIRRIGDLLGLARRAGQAVAGFEKARDWKRNHPGGLVLQAADGSAAERSRFRSALPEGVAVVDPLSGAELGRVFGHDAVVHVALAPGRLASTIAMETGRLAGLRTRSPEPARLTGAEAATTRATAEPTMRRDTNG